MSQYKIAPSILAADYANFEREIKRLDNRSPTVVQVDWSLLDTNESSFAHPQSISGAYRAPI